MPKRLHGGADCETIQAMRWHIALAAVLTMVVATTAPLAANDWPEWRGAGRLGIWTDTGVLDEFPAGGLTAAWRVPIGGGYAGPSVADGRVFVTDARRADPRSTAVVERLLALDEATGDVLWTREWDTNYAGLQLIYATGPRATATVDGDRVYAVGATGNLLALRVADGSVLWQTDYVRDFNAAIPSWGISGAPLVDGDRLISLVGGEPDAKVVAFDKLTGEVLWQALSSDWEPGYTAPILIDAAGTRQLIVWHPRAISSLDPETGAVYWEVPHIVDMGMTISTVVRSGPYLLVTSQWGGAVMLRLAESHPDAALVWEGVGQSDPEYGRVFDTIDSVMGTPVIRGDYVYGVDGHGVLRCLELRTGRRVWETDALIGARANHATAFIVRHGDRYFINTDVGELVIARLSPAGYDEISRTHLIDPTSPVTRRRPQGQGPVVHWSHPAYANRHIITRNDEEIVRFSLASTP